MSSEIITRVAKAMAEAAGFSWEHCAQSQWERDARAGISAMREPTEAMVSAADPHGIIVADFKSAWQTMIDEVLL